MDLALFRRLLTQLPPGQARYRPLELHHLGESLLHPQVVDFVQSASDHGLPTEMSVNPSLLTVELGEKLLAAGIGRLVISLDGTDEQTLVQIRGPVARYGKAEKHLAALLQAVEKRGTQAPQIVIQMIALAANQHQRADFLQRYGNLGLPTVQAYIKPLDGPDPDLAQSNAEPLNYLCSYPFRSVVVLWDGRVVPCCRDDDARYVLGDLNTQTLAEIWQGPAAQELRQRHREQRFPGGHLCDGCAFSPAAFVAAQPQRHPDRAAPAPLQW
jgi:radical SAM protein with 4Fe4S-binding SPASM domain